MSRALWIPGLLIAVVYRGGAAVDIVLENSRLRAVLGEDAVWNSWVDKSAGNECSAVSKRVRFADVRVGGTTRSANAARLNDDQLTVSFRDCDTQLVCAVSKSDDWIAFRIAEVLGTRPTHVTLLALDGPWRRCADRPPRFADCLRLGTGPVRFPDLSS